MDDNEKLIEQFMKQSRQEIVDDGFTERVMRGLPEHQPLYEWLPRVWNGVMILVALILFIAFGGVSLVKNALVQYLDSAMIQGIDMRWTLLLMVLYICFVCHKALKTA